MWQGIRLIQSDCRIILLTKHWKEQVNIFDFLHGYIHQAKVGKVAREDSL